MPFRTNRTTAPTQTGMPRPPASVTQQLQQRQQQQMASRAQRSRPPMLQPKFNVPNPIQAPMAAPQGSFFQPPVTAQNPVGGFQTPPAAPTPPVDTGNFGTIQDLPMPVSDVAMPTPNPVPMPLPMPGPAPMPIGDLQFGAPMQGPVGGPSIGFGPAPAPMLPGSLGDQMGGGINALPGIGIGFGPAPITPGMPQLAGGPAELQFDQFGNPLPQ